MYPYVRYAAAFETGLCSEPSSKIQQIKNINLMLKSFGKFTTSRSEIHVIPITTLSIFHEKLEPDKLHPQLFTQLLR